MDVLLPFLQPDLANLHLSLGCFPILGNQGVSADSHLVWKGHLENNPDDQFQSENGSDDWYRNRSVHLADLRPQSGGLWSGLRSGGFG